MFGFTIRDVLWLTLVMGNLCASSEARDASGKAGCQGEWGDDHVRRPRQ